MNPGVAVLEGICERSRVNSSGVGVLETKILLGPIDSKLGKSLMRIVSRAVADVRTISGLDFSAWGGQLTVKGHAASVICKCYLAMDLDGFERAILKCY